MVTQSLGNPTFKKSITLLAVGLVSLSLAACESRRSTKDMKRSTSVAPERTSSVASSAARSLGKSVTVSIEPVRGIPSKAARRIRQNIVSEMRKRNIKVVKKGGNYKLRGYLAASKASKGSKLTYIWDLIDRSGNRVQRTRGKNAVTGTGNAVWSRLASGTISKMARHAADRVVNYARTSKTQVARKAVRAPVNHAVARAESVKREMPVNTASIAPLEPKIIMAEVPRVVGAPSNGSPTLTRAIKNHLVAKGYKLVPGSMKGAYKIRGTVKVEDPKEGTQKVSILWNVFGPDGRSLGKVTQENNVNESIVQSDWGPISNAAAGAAIKGITKLMPTPKK